MDRPWIAFFSQTGSEIANIAESLGRWPDLIITNKDPNKCQDVDERIDRLYHLSAKPSVEEYKDILDIFENPIITLHGYLRILPKEVCEKFSIFNGHPGLITEYPELKGKDPQIRAFEGKYPVMGCVLHKVDAGVDEGKVLAEERFNAFKITEEEMWTATRDRSLSLWINFLKTMIGK